MRCRTVRKFLNRYVDHELSDVKTSSSLKEHLEACFRCKTELDALLLLKGALAGKERAQAPQDFLEGLKKRLMPEPQIIRLRWVVDMGSISKRLIPVPAIVMIIMAILLFGQIDKEQAVRGEALFGLNSEELLNINF